MSDPTFIVLLIVLVIAACLIAIMAMRRR